MPKRCYLIGYDLPDRGEDHEDYELLREAIIDLAQSVDGGYWRRLDSTWLITHPGSALQITDELNRSIKGKRRILVARIDGDDTAWTGFDDRSREWLNDHL